MNNEGIKINSIKPVKQEFELCFDGRNLPLITAIKAIHEYKVLPVSYQSQEANVSCLRNLFICDSKDSLVEYKKAHELMIDYVYAVWDVMLCWVLKEQLKLFDIHNAPYPESIMRATEPGAQLLIASLNLWESIIDNSPPGSMPYSNSVEAWTLTSLEEKRNDLKSVCQLTGTRKLADNMRSHLKLLELKQNPFSHKEFDEQHNYNMISAALLLFNSDNWKLKQKFCRKVWNPYKEAMHGWIKALRGGVELCDDNFIEFHSLFVKGNKLMLQDGKQPSEIYSQQWKPSYCKRGKYLR